MAMLKTRRVVWETLFGAAGESGQEIAEAALVLPILFLILLAIFWFGRAFNITSTLERAARSGIQTATHPSCVLCAPSNTYGTNAQVVASVKAALRDDHLNPSNLTTYSPPFACIASPSPVCTTLQGVEICSGAPLSCGSSACQSPAVACGSDTAVGTRVSFGYNFTSSLPIANLNAITITASALSESEQ